ncbi:MAG: hypothetical protein ABIO39_11115, partial [Caulobacteraceae bacterium]
KGEPARMSLAKPLKYIENRKDVDLKAGIVSTPQKIDFHRSLLDTQTCETFSEVIITDPAHPYVLGVHLKVAGGKVAEIDNIVTDSDDWLFAPARTLKFTTAENWAVLPKAARSDRATLIAAANAYFDYFDDKTKKTAVPWGIPCRRLEGALYTGKGQPDDSCDVGVPDKVKIVNRHFVVDEDIGAAVGLVTFGASGLPDSHLFRLENGKVRYIHTITVCFTPNCGFPVPAQLKAAP